jgi:hypothetical protein
VTWNFHYTPTSTTRNYYDEEIIDREVLLSFTNLERMRKYFQNAADRFPTGINIVGFSQENFKRFYKLPKVRQLTDCLYNVAFGDLNFTEVKHVYLKVGEKFKSCTLKKSIIQTFLVHLFIFK